MPASTTTTRFTQDGFDAFLASRDEPAWLTDIRNSSWKHFSSLPMPSRGDEQWARTDIRPLRLEQFSPFLNNKALNNKALEAPQGRLSLGVNLAGQTSSVDGQSAACTIDEKWHKAGVLFGNIDQLVASHGDLFKPHLLARAVNPHYDKFAALHGAFWTGGTLLYVPRNVIIDQPLHTLFALGDGIADLSHTLVVLEEGAEAILLSESLSMPRATTGLHCGAVELLLGPRSHFRYVNLQDWGHGVWHFSHQKALVDRDAHLQWTIGAIGSRLAKVNQDVALVGEGGQAEVNGIMFSEGKQHLCYQTSQHHEAANCRSDLLYKGALQDDSRIEWRGMIKVEPGAQGTDGYQRNDNLILDPGARADSIPGLEIEADDVRCTHGATSGRVDEQQLYYCQAHGLTRKEAIRLIVSGFLQQISDRISVKNVRSALGNAIYRRIRDHE